MEQEQWMIVPRTGDTLRCSSLGNWECYKYGKWVKKKTHMVGHYHKKKKGYRALSHHGKSYITHKVIAKLFIKSGSHKPYVNHKNGIRDDNRVQNLEWCTHKENINHARQMGFYPPNHRSVPVRCRANKIDYTSIAAAAKAVDMKPHLVAKMLRGEIPNTTTLRFKKNAKRNIHRPEPTRCPEGIQEQTA